MKHYLTPAGSYYQGDRASHLDIECAPRPSQYHVLATGWQTDPMNAAVCWREHVPAARAEANRAIDAAAEAARTQYLTSAPLQGATYVEKAREARAFKAAGYPAAPFSPLLWPYMDAEMRAAGDATPQAACDRILLEATQYAAVKGAAIEYARRKGKVDVSLAADLAGVSAARDAAFAALEAI